MLKENIEIILRNNLKYDGYTRARLLQECIHNKLKATVLKYNEEIEDNADYLLTRSSTKVLKALTKIQKADDKKTLKALANIENAEELENTEEELVNE